MVDFVIVRDRETQLFQVSLVGGPPCSVARLANLGDEQSGDQQDNDCGGTDRDLPAFHAHLPGDESAKGASRPHVRRELPISRIIRGDCKLSSHPPALRRRYKPQCLRKRGVPVA